MTVPRLDHAEHAKEGEPNSHTSQNEGASFLRSQMSERVAKASGAFGILATGMSLALPASHQILLGQTLNRRELLGTTGMFGMAAAEYILRPWSIQRDATSRSRLIVNRMAPNALDDVGALSLERTNFHERLGVSPIRARAALQA